ncbi:MAG: ABC transporter permease [Spirochaetaceae bacterium]|nr:ABC transporter permease [Spirochaetaceae bacterium]
MNFIFRRIVIALITVFLVSIFCFLAFSVIRGDPASFLAGINASQEQLSALREEMGLNRNVVTRYLEWLSGFLSGRTGVSFSFRGEAISSLVAQRLPVTVTLALLSLFFVLLISVPVSLLTVNREGSILDGIVNFFTAAGLSTPGFFMGLLFIFIFGFGLKLFIPGEYIDYSENLFGFIRCLCFPALAIALPNAAILVNFLRGSLFQELRSDYVITARSKGADGLYILRRHVLKNALLPAVTIFAMIIAEVFSGSIVIEQVFTIPGIGRLLIAAISSRDYPLIQSLMVYIAFIIVAANTLADIAIMIIDPRIREARDIR